MLGDRAGASLCSPMESSEVSGEVVTASQLLVENITDCCSQMHLREGKLHSSECVETKNLHSLQLSFI